MSSKLLRILLLVVSSKIIVANISVPTFSLDGNLKIVGGNITNITTVPYQVSLRTINNQHFCGGAIISEWHVLTAAHCVIDMQTDPIYCVFGANTVQNQPYSILVADKLIYATYNATTFPDDIALLTMRSKIPLNNRTIKIIPLITRRPVEGENCLISGWGVTSETSTGNSFWLRSAVVPIYNFQSCQTSYGNAGILFSANDGLICAGYKGGAVDSCQGDSGGPLQCNGKLAGVVSFGIGCARPTLPGVYTDVSDFLSWINKNVKLSAASWTSPSVVVLFTCIISRSF